MATRQAVAWDCGVAQRVRVREALRAQLLLQPPGVAQGLALKRRHAMCGSCRPPSPSYMRGSGGWYALRHVICMRKVRRHRVRVLWTLACRPSPHRRRP